jgi:hypothetical protein
MRTCQALAGLVAACVASTAGAQAMMTQGTGSCTGMLSGTVGIAFPDASGAFQSVSGAYIPYVFGQAECQCASTDLRLQIFLGPPSGMALPSGMTGTAEVWVGTGCDNYTARTQVGQTVCEKIGTLDINQFTLGGTSDGNIEIPLNGAAVNSPITHACTQAAASNSVYVFLYTSPSMPFATCTLQLNQQNQGPGAPASASASSGDSAVTVSWLPPNSTMTQPSFFQLLCADEHGNPLPGQPGSNAQQYSTCLPSGLKRRPLPTSGSIGTGTGTDDGGTTTADLGTASAPLTGTSLPSAPPSPSPAATDDGGVDLGAADMAVGGQMPTTTSLPAPFTNLDPALICSAGLLVSGTSYSQRIAGLTNGQTYQFVVLSIDRYGNATPSELLTATPQPVEDLYRRYYDSGGRATGFCFIATAAWGSYEHPFVQVLRDFRDEALLPSAAGRRFVDWYYDVSPPLAEYIAQHRAAKIGAQLALWPVIGAAALWLYTSAWLKALALICVLLLALRRRPAWRRRLAERLGGAWGRA